MPVIANSRETTEEIEYRFSGKEIASLCDCIQKGDYVEVVFFVPRGGDYSGTELEVSEKSPVIVRITRKTRERGLNHGGV